MASAGSGPQDDIREAVRALDARWEDDAAHCSFIAFCTARGALGEAGKYYRSVRDQDESRRSEAERRLTAILGAALAGLDARIDAQRAGRSKSRSRVFWLVCGVGLALLGCAVRAVLMLSSR